MGVSVDRDTGTVKDWVVYDKVYCGECKLPDNAFSPQVRNGSNRCRIVLNWTPSEDGFHSVTTEFTELRWLSGLESSVACLLGFGLISQGAFPYAVLLGRLTAFRAVGFLAIPLILQLVAYCYAFYGPKTVGLAAAKMMWLLLLHFLAFLVCFFVW
jgi:hypothetical protein